MSIASIEKLSDSVSEGVRKAFGLKQMATICDKVKISTFVETKK